MKLERFFEKFELFADAPDAVARMREVVLDLAVRGKLIHQNPDDEPAANLLHRIAIERELLIKEKQIRRHNLLGKVAEDLIPFDIPSYWQWCYLSDVCFLITDGAHHTPQYLTSGVPFLSVKDVSSGTIDFSNTKYISEESHRELCKRCRPEFGDILLTKIGTTGIAVTIDKNREFSIFVSLALLKFSHSNLDRQYLKYLINSPFVRQQSADNTQGVGNKNLVLRLINRFIVPLPPLAEQKRIVAKVDELMALCDQLEAQQQQRETRHAALVQASLARFTQAPTPTNLQFLFHPSYTVYPADLRKTILTLAVQGKIVPQDPNDEPAETFLEPRRAQLIVKIKRGSEKKAEGDNEKKPFDLPVGWAWAKFPELGEFGRGKSKHRPRNDPSLFIDGTHRLVQTGDVARSNGDILTCSNYYNDIGLAQSKKWPTGTLCITIAANIADSGILGFDACFPDSVVGFIPAKPLPTVRFFEYFMRTAKEHLEQFAPATAQKNINLGILEQLCIPLPPLNEQRRIVAKVDELMALVDELESQLATSRTVAQNLMAALVQELTTAH